MKTEPYLRPTGSGAAVGWTTFGQRIVITVLLMVGLAACEPSDRTPGLWLSGDISAFPEDWSFTQEHKEIFVEVSTPYYLSHSVTIWCASLEGTLYIGARDPDSKNWPGWVDSNPNIRLKIGDQLFDAQAQSLDNEEVIQALRAVYAEKYELPANYLDGPANTKYWMIVPQT